LKIGIKYCGGCNPRYDRKKFIEQIKEALGENFTFEVAKEEEMYDFLLVVGGCTNCCANFTNIRTEKGIFCIKKHDDYEKVIHVIKKIHK
jgi:4-hydroxybutyrate CoA-transferase